MARLIDADKVENALLEQMRVNADNNQKSRNIGLLQARNMMWNKINEIIDAVNELRGV